MTDLRAAAERLRELSGDVRDCLDGNLPHDSLTYRGSLLSEVMEAALVLLSKHPADEVIEPRKQICSLCGQVLVEHVKGRPECPDILCERLRRDPDAPRSVVR